MDIFVVYVFYKTAWWGWLGKFYASVDGDWLPTSVETAVHTLGFVQFMLVMVLALNRCCAITWPTKLEEV